MYQTQVDGQHHELGTSGFLYRSNKLMYDHETKSLWSTLKGEPVVGPLVGKDIRLKRSHVVTTTWGEWRKRHPSTKVLSLETGHVRDYGEGMAYHDYFATQDLMFEVPEVDDRLRPKDEVLALRNDAGQLAISVRFLADNKVYSDQLGEQRFVIITDSTGANRVYESGDIQFTSIDGGSIVDSNGGHWTVSELALEAADGQRSLKRLPAHRVYWFGWFAQYPDTRLIK